MSTKSKSVTLNDTIGLSINTAVQAIITNAGANTFFLEGAPGSGKTFATAAALKAAGYKVHLVSCQNLVAEELAEVPVTDAASRTVEFYPHKKWQPVSGERVAFILDELPKAHEDVFNAFCPLLFGFPRMFCGYEYPADTVVVITGNSAVFKAKDQIKPHHINRLTTINVSDPTPDEARSVAMTLGWDAAVIEWIKTTPSVLVSYSAKAQSAAADVLDNYFGFLETHPRTPFCSMRSLDAASRLVSRHRNTPSVLNVLLAGTIGQKAARSLTTYLAGIGEWIDPLDIVSNPETTKIPKSLFDQRLTAISCAASMTPSTWRKFHTYVQRLNKECQMIFGVSMTQRGDLAAFRADSAFNSMTLKYLGE